MKEPTGGRLVLILPMHNEAACIGRVVREIKECAPDVPILAIDDGSTDQSASIAEKAGAVVIRLPYNLGIGGAVQTGYALACELSYDVVARMDSDGQHNPADLFKLVDCLASGDVDMAIGSRYMNSKGYSPSLARSLGAKFFAAVVSVLTGRRFNDTTSGFQVLNARTARFLARYLPADYPEIEGLVLLCRSGFRVSEVPVCMRPRLAGNSSISAPVAAYYVFKVLLAVLIGLMRKLPERTEVDIDTR